MAIIQCVFSPHEAVPGTSQIKHSPNRFLLKCDCASSASDLGVARRQGTPSIGLYNLAPPAAPGAAQLIGTHSKFPSFTIVLGPGPNGPANGLLIELWDVLMAHAQNHWRNRQPVDILFKG